MKKMLLALAIALLLVPAMAFAESEAETGTEGEVVVGWWGDSTDGSEAKTLEYEVSGNGPILDAEVNTLGNAGSMEFLAEIRDGDQQRYGLDFDIKRMVRSENKYRRFIHRFARDPMENLSAATPHGRSMYHTDTVPDDHEFGITYSVLESETDFQFPGAPGLTLTAGFRHQDRTGDKQVKTVSHCDSCHVVSQKRPVDETTRDAELAANYAWDKGAVSFSYLWRTFGEGQRNIDLQFDNALHPEKRIPIFDNRLQWDNDEGPQPVDVVPDVDKNVGKVKLTLGDLGGIALSAGGVFSTTENQDTMVQSNYTGYMLNAARRYKTGWAWNWRGRYYTADTDDFMVITNERVTYAGPQAGKTYREVENFEPNFLRQSANNRDVLESKLDVSYRISRKAGTLKFEWDYDTVDREYYEVAPGETKTTTNILGLNYRIRPAKGMRFDARLRYASVSNPFMTINTQYSTLFSQKTASPFDPRASQYYEMQDARIGDATAAPSSWTELKLFFMKNFGQSTLSASYRYWNGDNSDGDLTSWSRTQQVANVSLFGSPDPMWSWVVAYTYNDTGMELPATVPLFDG